MGYVGCMWNNILVYIRWNDGIVSGLVFNQYFNA